MNLLPSLTPLTLCILNVNLKKEKVNLTCCSFKQHKNCQLLFKKTEQKQTLTQKLKLEIKRKRKFANFQARQIPVQHLRRNVQPLKPFESGVSSTWIRHHRSALVRGI